jgi:hypothetical protein
LTYYTIINFDAIIFADFIADVQSRLEKTAGEIS